MEAKVAIQNSHKTAYVVPCSNTFRNDVLELAKKKKVNAGDLARSIFLIFSKEEIEAFPDTAEPDIYEREEVVLKSGTAKGQSFKRKPRLQVRMPQGLSASFIRKSLLMALALEKKELSLELDQKQTPKKNDLKQEIDRLKTVISHLAFEPLRDGVRSKDEALFVLGFPPHSNPDLTLAKVKFRILASIFHPDSIFGSHDRMSNINSAMDFFRNR
ncbi:MAG: J domain-containing protein [Alphaproteobacteria bacterium]